MIVRRFWKIPHIGQEKVSTAYKQIKKLLKALRILRGKKTEIIFLADNRLSCSSVLPLHLLIANLACRKILFHYFLSDLCLPWVDGSFNLVKWPAPMQWFLDSSWILNFPQHSGFTELYGPITWIYLLCLSGLFFTKWRKAYL